VFPTVPIPERPGESSSSARGLAGLTAAVHLRDAGWDVLVLEARERVGGRVHTLYGGDPGIPLDRGLRVDVGGESVDDTHAPLLGMVRRFGLDTERRPEAPVTVATRGGTGIKPAPFHSPS
jgi:monoamine oxidase